MAPCSYKYVQRDPLGRANTFHVFILLNTDHIYPIITHNCDSDMDDEEAEATISSESNICEQILKGVGPPNNCNSLTNITQIFQFPLLRVHNQTRPG